MPPSESPVCIHCGRVKEWHTTTLNGALQPMCPLGTSSYEPSSSSSPSESLAQPDDAIGKAFRVIRETPLGDLPQLCADAELGALLRAAIATDDPGALLIELWCPESPAISRGNRPYANDATRALSSALSRTARAAAQGG